MYLENLVFDAVDPQRSGRFWEEAIGGLRLTDAPGIYETRLLIGDGVHLDLCFQGVTEAPTGPSRLRLYLGGGADPGSEVDRLVGLGAVRPGSDGPGVPQGGDPGHTRRIGEANEPGVDLLDPEGTPFRVLGTKAAADEGPVPLLLLDSDDPGRDARLWSWLTGWTPQAPQGPGSASVVLRGLSGAAPALELRQAAEKKGSGKNRVHLDVRLEPGDDADAVLGGVAERGGRELHFDWGDLPWRHFADPSGNEWCLLPVPAEK